MRATKWIFPGLVLLVVIGGVFLLLYQRTETAALQRAIAQQRERLHTQTKAQAELLAENARLRALQISETETKRLEDEQEAVMRLRAELKEIFDKTQLRLKNARPSPPLPARAWRNMGSALPSAAFETILWAGAGGDIDTLAGLLMLTPEAQAKAEALYAELSDKNRARYASPEHLIASFTARDVPLTAVGFTGSTGGVNKLALDIRFFAEDGTMPMREYDFTVLSTSGGWRLSVPVEAVEKYAAILKAPEGAGAVVK